MGADWEPPAREAAEEVRHLRGERLLDTSFCKAEESHIGSYGKCMSYLLFPVLRAAQIDKNLTFTDGLKHAEGS